MDMCTLLCLEWMTYKVRCYCRAHRTAQSDAAAWMGGAFGGEWIHVYAWLSPFAVHLK